MSEAHVEGDPTASLLANPADGSLKREGAGRAPELAQAARCECHRAGQAQSCVARAAALSAGGGGGVPGTPRRGW